MSDLHADHGDQITRTERVDHNEVDTIVRGLRQDLVHDNLAAAEKDAKDLVDALTPDEEYDTWWDVERALAILEAYSHDEETELIEDTDLDTLRDIETAISTVQSNIAESIEYRERYEDDD